jgi:hypothetical protein
MDRSPRFTASMRRAPSNAAHERFRAPPPYEAREA